ncbi:MAG: hypothetical protein L0212_01520 [Acidobacteria bacterium]|nr:hypothetical protein [Acidobacteriota bacterium]
MAQAMESPAGTERRRGQRIFLVVPIELRWKDSQGKPSVAKGETGIVSAFGATLVVKGDLPEASEVEVRVPSTGETAHARIIGRRPPAPDGSAALAVELAASNEHMWGVQLPPPPIYSFRLHADPIRHATALAGILQALARRKLSNELILQLNSSRPLPADLWKELQDLLDAAGIVCEKNL